MIRRTALILAVLGVTAPEVGAQALAVDHVWIHVSPGAPERQALIDAGIDMAFEAQHTGQGTASTGPRFRNVYLELIWVDDAAALRAGAPDASYTLLGGPAASPFGVGLRHVADEGPTATLPFPSTSYWAPWMWPGVSLAMAVRGDNASADPAIFVVPNYLRWDTRVRADPELLESAEHGVDIHDVTTIRIHGPGLPSDSPGVQFLVSRGLVEFAKADEHLLELVFDGGGRETIDLRPDLPLIIRH